MSDGKIIAPWKAEEVDALNRFQNYGFIHEFTCPGHDGGGDRKLIATRRGWICPHCDYTQSWAHATMLQEFENPIDQLRRAHGQQPAGDRR